MARTPFTREAQLCARIVNPGIVRTIALGPSTHSAPSLAVREVANLLEDIGSGHVASDVWQSFDEGSRGA